ncbi:MAG TPA: hypothetical protein VKP66_14600 [Steroidobacteraceae bacterium]|nr:hypothetical protein [Steroidobacteraceae bacterium]
MNILGSTFHGRKRLHYLIAGFSSIAAMCIHFYYIGQDHSHVSQPIADVVGLGAYDYRLTIELAPIFIVNWLVQFFLIYLFVLLAWDVGILGRCVQQFQRQIAHCGIQQKAEFLRHAGGLAGQQTIVRWSAIVVVFIALSACGYFKWSEFSAVSFNLPTALQICYFFSPAFTISGLLWFATPQMYADYDKIRTDRRKKLTEEDIDFIRAAFAQVPEIAKLIVGIVSLVEHSK